MYIYRNNGLNWASQIKNILESLGRTDLWVNQEHNNNLSLDVIKERILDQYKQSWYSAINNSQRLLSYCRFKHNFNLEGYLDVIQENKFKIALSRFRLSSHSLEIERGRYTNVPREDRICKVCNSSFVENEYHFLLVCPAYRLLRRQYMKPYFCSWPSLNKFDNLMSSKNKKEISNLSNLYILQTKK